QTATQTATVTQTATTTVTQTPPPPPSLKPPLSPEIKQRVEAIKQQLAAKREGESVVYTSCYPFWGGLYFLGMMRVRIKNGVVVGIEPDDTINTGAPREDEKWDNVVKGLIQCRGSGSASTRAYSYRRYMYRPERLLYPMKRIGPRGDPHAKFVRISWDEALTTIANKMLEIKNKYGPYSIAGFYTSPFPLASYIGAGCTGWGIASNESANFATEYVLGGYDADCDIVGIFNAKLIVIWSAQPTSTNLGAEAAYYIKLAKEKGIPVITIDPRYSKEAEVLSDQWIPIRPGTDVAMMLAIANVLFKENLYDKEYVDKFVEPKGLAVWKDYVLGVSDGVDKTPEWQEKITGVPAETVREFARLYARSKPTWLIFSWCASRQHRGENPARAAIYLQALTGNIGVLGGYTPNNQGGGQFYFPTPATIMPGYYGGIMPPMFGMKPPTYTQPVLFMNYKWADAVLLREKYEKGELTKEEYHQIIGNPADNPTPNIKMVWFMSNLLNQVVNINKQIEAVKKLEFCVAAVWHVDQPTAMIADIILPRAEVFEEDPTFVSVGFSGWAYAPRIVKPQGEAKSLLWIMVNLAKKLGVIQNFAPDLANVTDEEWDATMDKFIRESYEKWAAANNYKVPWDEFVKKPIYRAPIDKPYVAYAAQIQGGKRFGTPSGKIEFYSEYLAKGEDFLKTTKYGGFIKPYAEYVHIREGYFDPKVKRYPLMVISPHSRYRMHSWQDGDPMLRRDVYRHSVWINVADAKTRGIKDGDLVRVYNDVGEMVLPAYVTSKIVPGTVNIWEGGWFTPNRAGIDRRGAPNLLHPDIQNPDGQWPFHGLVEVEKF
ncbi:MAG: molybdopterin-dependent oxidoreductase, partial [Nitrososphaerales archaeon]